jgi:glucokinase
LLALVGDDGGPLTPLAVPNPAGWAERYWPAILNAAEALLSQAAAAPVGVGVSFGGPVDNEGRVLSIHVAGWGGLDPVADLRARLGLPVRIENDANCGALGETRFGRWGTVHTLVFLTCSTGIGGGIVSAGRLFKGSHGVAGELGHICLDPAGPPCPCGRRGCLEALCSGTAMARRAAEATGREFPGAKEVFAAAAAGDAVCQAVLEAVFADFGRGLAAIHQAFDPDLIVIGGGVSLAGAALTGPLTAAARAAVMAGRGELVRVEAAALGLCSQLYGAAALAFDGEG